MLLTPELAANAAIAAYNLEPLRGFPTFGDLDSEAGDYVGSQLLGGPDTNRVTPIMGTSGSKTLGWGRGDSSVKTRSGFAFVARGAANSQWRDHLVVAIRGTATTPDIISDLNSSLTPRQGNGLTHGGFGDVLDSMMSSLDRQTNNFNGHQAVHVVGHSLGGAIATLLCANLLSRKIPNVHCYTFGAPRVGDLIFATWMQTKIGADRFKRVYHPGDPVPMVPVFPFFHAPHASGIALPAATATLLNGAHHKMKTSYLPVMRRHSDWAALETAARGRSDWQIEVQAWLSGQRGLSDVLPSSARLLKMIGRAIVLILEKAVVFGLCTIGTVAATTLDHVAELLHMAWRGCKLLAGYVETVVKGILRFLGRAMLKVADLTVSFLRWLLDALRTSVIAAGTGVLNMID